ncbi:hypothetical protein PILCRDRAFT_7427 [Piloderma croceum F 1598]|uniref:Uncharacterized protein n=1 Tax=Piloderma croceum (strain F 1598) TaxID=765440 RepID=A0A0C3FES9_PILCF|nr:hypothetical protein PILCRDRAFT_7427 [Piloderma croceum F 1598]
MLARAMLKYITSIAYSNAKPVGLSKQISVFLYEISATATAVHTGVMQVNYR